MNVATIAMPKAEARARLKAYRAGLHRKADAEWAEVEHAYKELANGRPILLLSQVFAACPRDERGRPKLAIARADRMQVTYNANPHSREESFSTEATRRRGPDYRIAVPRTGVATEWRTSYALVPLVPPDVKQHHALDTHFILWEVEQWADRRIGARADRDPYLLRRVSADVFAIVAEWDLTEIERAVMQSFRRSAQ